MSLVPGQLQCRPPRIYPLPRNVSTPQPPSSHVHFWPSSRFPLERRSNISISRTEVMHSAPLPRGISGYRRTMSPDAEPSKTQGDGAADRRCLPITPPGSSVDGWKLAGLASGASPDGAASQVIAPGFHITSTPHLHNETKLSTERCSLSVFGAARRNCAAVSP
jgi:hypothetical protein